MKTKNFRKKLTFNKQTIADFNNDEMKGVYGGALAPSAFLPPSGCTCSCLPSAPYACCPIQ